MSKRSSGIPAGTVIGAGFAQWHLDETEILNSSRPAASGNFCLGVWKKTRSFHYTLNHFALPSDPSTDSLLGPAQLREDIDPDHGADDYFGTFTLDQFHTLGHLLVHLEGTVPAIRAIVNAPLADVL